MSELVLVTNAEGTCEVRLNRPEKRNAITFAMYEQLTHALGAAQADDQVRAVLLSGAGACRHAVTCSKPYGKLHQTFRHAPSTCTCSGFAQSSARRAR